MKQRMKRLTSLLSNKTKEEMSKFFISEQSEGGLDLILPGVYFNIMKAT